LEEAVKANPVHPSATELLKVIFNLTMRLGFLDGSQPTPTNEDVRDFQR
jgi:hypothetical protein